MKKPRTLVGWMLLGIVSFASARLECPCLGQATAETASPPIQVFFSPRASDAPDGIYRNLVRFLGTAKRTIHASAHEVDMVAIAELLAAKAASGVEVEIVVESRWWSIAKNTAARQVLEHSRVKIIPDNRDTGLMHNKFFVVDGERVWTGSANITETCLLYNANNSIWIESRQVAENFTGEFQEQKAGRFGRARLGRFGSPHPVAKVAGIEVETYFSPEDGPLSAVVRVIDAARKSVDVACFVFSSQEVADALIAAKKRGVVVRVLLDNSFEPPSSTAHWRFIPARDFPKAGIAMRFDRELAKMHQKTVVVDDEILVTGSMNLSRAGAEQNDENIVIVHSADIATRCNHEFETLWAAAALDSAGAVLIPGKDNDGEE